MIKTLSLYHPEAHEYLGRFKSNTQTKSNHKLRTNLHTPNFTQTSRRLGEKPRQKTNKCWIIAVISICLFLKQICHNSPTIKVFGGHGVLTFLKFDNL